MKVRTVKRQEQDGVGLAEAAKDEAVFEFGDVRGDLVGFRLPGYVSGINAPGWHLHFMDADRKQCLFFRKCALYLWRQPYSGDRE